MADNAPARRRYIINADASGAVDREELFAWLGDIGSVLIAVGGSVSIAAQRAKYDEAGGEPIAATVQIVAEWRGHSPLSMADYMTAEVDPDNELELVWDDEQPEADEPPGDDAPEGDEE